MRRAVWLACWLSLVPTTAGAIPDPFDPDEPPEPPEHEPPAWHRQRLGDARSRAWLAPSLATLPAEKLSFAGAMLGLGGEILFPVEPAINRWFFGSTFGLEARLHALASVEGTPRSALLATGIAFTGYVAESGFEALDIVRWPAVFALTVPEAGVAFRDRQPTSFYLRWSAPVAVLVGRHFAVEVVPAVSLLYQSPGGDVEALWQLGIAVSWRQLDPLPYWL